MGKATKKPVTGHKDIVEARRFKFEQMVNLSKGKITIDEALAQGKLAHHLMEGYKTQVRAMEVMSTSHKKLASNTTKELER